MPGKFLDPSSHRAFRSHLLNWFDREKRALPWRGETDPYRILVSEIMLQQTRVAVVKERYATFLRRFPDVSRLAHAREASVLAAWSGLGYYRRARALHAASREIRKQRTFPACSTELNQLPGIGRYTAAAVASIAFGEPVAVVDGNVKRVLDRLSGHKLSHDSYWRMAQELLEKRRPGDFNQAMMELGATICLSGQPLCQRCPVVQFCASQTPKLRSSSRVQKAPSPRKKATLSYLLVLKNDTILLHQRSARLSLMPGMWELPQIQPTGRQLANPILRLKHSITKTDYKVSVFTAGTRTIQAGSWINLGKVNGLPLTGLARKALRKLDLLR
jgi:A/G-specific adenine glycosylase